MSDPKRQRALVALEELAARAMRGGLTATQQFELRLLLRRTRKADDFTMLRQNLIELIEILLGEAKDEG